MNKLSIVVPVYNSEDCLVPLHQEIEIALEKYPHELILVNDGSRDNSWEKVKRISEANSNVIGINLRKNSGQDNAIMAGLSRATGDYIVIMDDDLQHSPFDIPRLYEEIERGYDICFANFLSKKQAWWKNFGSWLNGKLAEIIIDKPTEIYLSPFKIIRKEVIDEILGYHGPFPYIDGLLFQITDNISQINADHHERYKGQSNYNLFKSIKVFLKLATSFSVTPLRFASISGILTALAGGILGLYYIIEFFRLGNSPEGWTTLTVLTLFLGGTILMCLGMIGEYLGRAYLNLNKKPQYIIKETTRDKNTSLYIIKK